MKLNFRNDYNTIGDVRILNKLLECASERNIGYGEDVHSQELKKMVCHLCDRMVDTYILSGGTVTNIVGLNQMLKYPYEAVITVEESHINVHETGAIEATGHKIIYTPSKNGKIDIDSIKKTYYKYSDNHMVMPRVLYISNANEQGITYKIDELRKISQICKKLGLYFFIDGARLPVAMAKEGYSLKEIASLCDMFYLGGTKNGLMYGELLIIVTDELKTNFKYLLKNKLGLLAKGFATSIAFTEYLKDDYYLVLARNSLAQADKIRTRLHDYLVYNDNANQVFIKVSSEVAQELAKEVEFEVWEKQDEATIIRLVTTYNTTDEEINYLFKVFDSLNL